MDLETFHLPSRSNRVPQSTPEIINLDTYRLSGKRVISEQLSNIPRVASVSEVIDLSDEEDDDDIKILNFIPKSTSFGKRKRIDKGESSNSRNAPFVCEICTDTKTMRDAFYISGCSHVYCSDCVAMYICSKLDDNITNIGCPVPGCSGLLEPEYCYSILKPEVFERWGKALCEALIDVSEKFYCPFADCSALLINDGTEAVGNTKCPHCNRMFCAQCKVPWHNGIECSEFEKLHTDERGREDVMLVNLAKKKNWQRCPKCRIYVARNRGCNTISCRCGCRFCYKCGYLSGMCVCYELKTRGIPSTVSIGGNFPLHPTNIAQIYQQNFTGGIFTSENFPNRNPPNSYKPQQQNFFGISGGVSTSGNFPNRNHPYSYKPQQPNYSRISGGVSTDGVFTGGNFPNWNPPCSYKPQQQFSSEISGGVSTSGTFPYGYPINSAQPRQQIPNGVAYTVQQQEQIPSIGSTTGTLPHVFG
ncbi:RBR-type E3 ubiquitin transferase [Trifolium repens]|nr:RBR-type E3 ubiquitin transferase [Trifolium repens]